MVEASDVANCDVGGVGKSDPAIIRKQWEEIERLGLRQFAQMANRRAREGRGPIDIFDKDTMLSACAEAGRECSETFEHFMNRSLRDCCFPDLELSEKWAFRFAICDFCQTGRRSNRQFPIGDQGLGISLMCYLNSLTTRMTGVLSRLGLGPSMSSIRRMADESMERWPTMIAEKLKAAPQSCFICLNDDYVRATAYRSTAVSGGVGRTSRTAWYVTSINVIRPPLPPILVNRNDAVVKFSHLGSGGLLNVTDSVFGSTCASWHSRSLFRDRAAGGEVSGRHMWFPITQNPPGASRLEGMLTDVLPTACHSPADILLSYAYSFWRLLPNFESGARSAERRQKAVLAAVVFVTGDSPVVSSLLKLKSLVHSGRHHTIVSAAFKALVDYVSLEESTPAAKWRTVFDGKEHAREAIYHLVYDVMPFCRPLPPTWHAAKSLTNSIFISFFFLVNIGHVFMHGRELPVNAPLPTIQLTLVRLAAAVLQSENVIRYIDRLHGERLADLMERIGCLSHERTRRAAAGELLTFLRSRLYWFLLQRFFDLVVAVVDLERAMLSGNVDLVMSFLPPLVLYFAETGKEKYAGIYYEFFALLLSLPGERRAEVIQHWAFGGEAKQERVHSIFSQSVHVDHQTSAEGVTKKLRLLMRSRDNRLTEFLDLGSEEVGVTRSHTVMNGDLGSDADKQAVNILHNAFFLTLLSTARSALSNADAVSFVEAGGLPVLRLGAFFHIDEKREGGIVEVALSSLGACGVGVVGVGRNGNLGIRCASPECTAPSRVLGADDALNGGIFACATCPHAFHAACHERQQTHKYARKRDGSMTGCVACARARADFVRLLPAKFCSSNFEMEDIRVEDVHAYLNKAEKVKEEKSGGGAAEKSAAKLKEVLDAAGAVHFKTLDDAKELEKRLTSSNPDERVIAVGTETLKNKQTTRLKSIRSFFTLQVDGERQTNPPKFDDDEHQQPQPSRKRPKKEECVKNKRGRPKGPAKLHTSSEKNLRHVKKTKIY